MRRASSGLGRGDLEGAGRELAVAAASFRAAGSPREVVALGSAADVARASGRLAEATELLRSATEVLRRTPGAARERPPVQIRLGAVLLQQGAREEGLALLRAGLEGAVAAGQLAAAANAALALGDDARHHDDPEAAGAWYEQARRSTPVPYLRGIAELDAAMAFVGAGRPERAAERLARALRLLTAPRYRAFASVVRLAIEAAEDEPRWRVAWEEALDALSQPDVRAEPDAAWCVERAVVAARRAGRPERAAALRAQATALRGRG